MLGEEAARSLVNKDWESGLKRFKVMVAGKYDVNFQDGVTEKTFYDYLKFKNFPPPKKKYFFFFSNPI